MSPKLDENKAKNRAKNGKRNKVFGRPSLPWPGSCQLIFACKQAQVERRSESLSSGGTPGVVKVPRYKKVPAGNRTRDLLNE